MRSTFDLTAVRGSCAFNARRPGLLIASDLKIDSFRCNIICRDKNAKSIGPILLAVRLQLRRSENAVVVPDLKVGPSVFLRVPNNIDTEGYVLRYVKGFDSRVDRTN